MDLKETCQFDLDELKSALVSHVPVESNCETRFQAMLTFWHESDCSRLMNVVLILFRYEVAILAMKMVDAIKKNVRPRQYCRDLYTSLCIPSLGLQNV
jgi:hypothetical protein